MARLKWVVCCLAVTLCFSAATLAQEEVKKDVKAKVAKKARKARKKVVKLRGEYAIMSKTVVLTEEQQTQLKDVLDAATKASAELKKTNAEKAKALKQAVAAAKKKKDKEALQKAQADLKAQAEAGKTAAEALDTKKKADVMALLNDEQKAKWQGFTAYRDTCKTYAKAGLTKDQKAKAREICTAAAKEGKTGEELDKAIAEKVDADVLTDKQKARLKKIADQKAKAKQPKAKKAKAKKAKKAEE